MSSLTKKGVTDITMPYMFSEGKEPSTFAEYQKLIQAFLDSTEKIIIGSTTREDLFLLRLNPEAMNVLCYPGEAQEAKNYMGTPSVQFHVNYSGQWEEHMSDISRYEVIVYPLSAIKESNEGGFYFGNQRTTKYGSNTEYVIILKDGKVKRKYRKGTGNIAKIKIVEESFEGGFWNMLRDMKETGQALQSFILLYLLWQNITKK